MKHVILKKVSQLVLLFVTFIAVSFYLTIIRNDAQIYQEHLVLKYLSLFPSKPKGGDKPDSDNKRKASVLELATVYLQYKDQSTSN